MDKEYYVSTMAGDGKPLIYKSEIFKFSEIDLINLIKICLVDERNKSLGRKFLEVYRDSTKDRKDKIAQERLTKIGIKPNGENKPTTADKAQFK